MNMYIIHYRNIGSDQVRQTRPIAGVDEKDAVADFRRNALDFFKVIKVELTN